MKNKIMVHKKGIPATLFIVVIFLTLQILILAENFTTLETALPYGITLLFIGIVLFGMLFSGRVHTWRNIFFSSYAVAFVIAFLWDLMVDGRGHMWLLDSETLQAEAPMCNIVPVMEIFPLLLRRVNAFPADITRSIRGVVMVLALGLVFGRGYCSWGCFFGGQESLFASIPKKKRWKIDNPPSFLRYFSFALLTFIVLHSFATLTPTYCIWLCPFKLTTEFFQINSGLRIFQTFLFTSLWVTLVVVLPLLTKKRTQCSFLCPLGAFLSLTNSINLFYIKIDRDRCIDCGRCIEVCPTFSLSKESVSRGRTLLTCTKCGACMEACPQQAVSFHIRGVSAKKLTSPSSERPGGHFNGLRRFLREVGDTGTIFIFPIFFLASFLASSDFASTIDLIIRFLGIEL